MKAVGYIRVSTEDQAREGVSLDNQKARIEAYCQYRDFTLVGIIEDAGISGGKNRGRVGFLQLLDTVEQGHAAVIILYDLERLSRDMLTLLALERLLDEQDVELHTIEGQIDSSTPDGFMNFAMKAFLGEMERRQVKYRTRRAMQHKKQNGEVVGAVPYGWTRTGDALALDPDEQAVIKKVNRLYARDNRLSEIVAKLNKAGLRTRTGKRWTATQVKRLLANYTGSFRKSRTKMCTAARQFIEAIA